MNYEGFKHLVGCMDAVTLWGLVQESDALSDEERSKLYIMITTNGSKPLMDCLG